MIYSILKPPKEPLALDNVLEAILSSKERFVETRSVQFKNYMFSDKAIELATQLFPSLEKLDLDGGKITIEGMKLLQKFRKLRFLSVYCKDQRNWDPKVWLEPLESHLERLIIRRGKFNSLFMKKCTQCNFLFNPKLNSSTSCLYHPGVYTGYGHSCSSFQCCGSNTPCYMGTPGCAYSYHVSEGVPLNYSHEEWLPEFIDIPYKDGVELFGSNYLSERRDPESIE